MQYYVLWVSQLTPLGFPEEKNSGLSRVNGFCLYYSIEYTREGISTWSTFTVFNRFLRILENEFGNAAIKCYAKLTLNKK